MSLDLKKKLELADSYLAKAGEILYELINTQSPTPTVDATERTGKQRLVEKKINNTFVPAEIAQQVNITEGDGLYVVTKEWSPNKSEWIEINNFVKDVGGKWVSAGRDSRWEILKK